MTESVAKKATTKQAPEKGQHYRPKDAQDTESQASYFARKYMEAQAVYTNARVQSEIDEITRRVIDVEQQLLAAQSANKDFTLLLEKLAILQSERRAKKELLVFWPIEKRNR